MPALFPQSSSDLGDDVLVVSVGGTWLRSDRLRVGLVKPPSVGCTLEVIRDDESRHEAMRLSEAVFGGAAPPMNLTDDFNDEPGVVIFPEYAFGSKQFSALDDLVKKQTMPLIVMAGFGATWGAKLNEQLTAGLFLAGWSGVRRPVADKRYNGAWVWVRRPTGATQAYLVLKHLSAQGEKYQIPELGDGFGRLVLEMGDMVIVPLLCSDFVLHQAHADSAHREVRQVLGHGRWGGCKRIVVGSIFEPNPSHNLWRQAIGGLVTNAPGGAAIICNHDSPSVCADEDSDRFRCGSGFWLGGQPPPRRQVYARHTRRVDGADKAYHGMVVRDGCAGITLGKASWSANAAGQLIPFEVTRRARFEAGVVNSVLEKHCPPRELSRWLARVALADGPDQPVPHPWLVQQLDLLTGKIGAGAPHDRLWPGIEVGPLDRNAHPIIDEVVAGSSNNARSVRSGLRAVAAVLGMPGASLIAAPLAPGVEEGGQISFAPATPASPKRFVSVWTPSTFTSAQIDETNMQCARDLRVANAVLVVVADSHTGVVEEGPIRPKPLPGQKRAAGLLMAAGVVPARGDFDAELPSEEESDFSQPPFAPVFVVDYRKMEKLFQKPAADLIAADVEKLITTAWN